MIQSLNYSELVSIFKDFTPYLVWIHALDSGGFHRTLITRFGSAGRTMRPNPAELYRLNKVFFTKNKNLQLKPREGQREIEREGKTKKS